MKLTGLVRLVRSVRRSARLGGPLRVCLSACVYEPDPSRRRLRQMLDSAIDAGTTDFAIALDRKSTPGTLRWVRWHLMRRRGLLASLLRPARVVEFDWQDDFAHARNVALDLVPPGCDWWYAIDNDDVLEPRDRRSLPEVLGELPVTCRVLRIPYLVPDHDGVLAGESMYETFFRGPVTYRSRRAWGEFVEPIDRRAGGSLCSTAVIRRHDRDWSINRSRGANSRNDRIIRKALEADPNDHGLWAFWGQCCCNLLDWEDAVASWERALDLCSSTRGKLGIARKLVPACTVLGRFERALDLGRLARELHPERPEPYFIDGRARFMAGDFRGAIESVTEGLRRMDAVARLEDRSLHSCLPSEPAFYDCEPFFLLASSYGQLGEFRSALHNVQLALAARPPKLLDIFLRWLQAYCEAGERPPFLGEVGPRVIRASSAAIARIRSYETQEAAIADLDAIMPYLMAPDVDLWFVLESIDRYFGESPPTDEVAA